LGLFEFQTVKEEVKVLRNENGDALSSSAPSIQILESVKPIPIPKRKLEISQEKSESSPEKKPRLTKRVKFF